MKMRVAVKKKCVFAFCLLLGAIFIVMYSSVDVNKYIFIVIEEPPRKYILYWTTMFGNEAFNLGLGSEMFKRCEYKNCYATSNRSLVPLDQFSAILFHGAEYSAGRQGKPENRTPDQVYVYSNQESPIHTPFGMGGADGIYNWTMSYRLDSDISRTYGYIIKEPTEYKLPTIRDIKNKEFRIAWFVSNCATSSKRRKLADEINKFIPVDIYGSCGNFTCSKSNNEECYKLVEKKYKFYFSAENSVCLDYVTEKLFYVMKKNVIPLVYGGAQYEKITPPKSVIDVTSYDTVKDLVTYLKFLDRNPEEYLEYFEWKKHYIVDTSSEVTICALCEKLNKPIERKMYESIHNWWSGGEHSVCQYGKTLPKIVLNLDPQKTDEYE